MKKTLLFLAIFGSCFANTITIYNNNTALIDEQRVLKSNGSIFICCSYHNIGECIMGLKNNGFKINNIILGKKQMLCQILQEEY